MTLRIRIILALGIYFWAPSVLLLPLCVTQIYSRQAKSRPSSEDELLRSSILAFIKSGLPLQDAEKQLRKVAYVNTLTEPDGKDALHPLRLCRDEINSAPFLPDESKFVDAVCWKRPVKSKHTRLIGIYSTRDGTLKLFYARLGIPE